VTDPQRIAWEHYLTLAKADIYSEGRSTAPDIQAPASSSCAGAPLAENPSEWPSRQLRPAAETSMATQPKHNVLFICTGNSARSIIAESLLNQLGSERFAAFSAGSHPKGAVHPLTLETLRTLRIEDRGYSSKSWAEFAKDGAAPMDFVITVCDQAAGEVCPVWPGQPITAHWGLPDPAAVDGSDEEKKRAFMDTAVTLKRRIEFMLSLPMDKLERMAIQREVREIGSLK
jgi:arsenate reductase